jgi:hypothetical protein
MYTRTHKMERNGFQVKALRAPKVSFTQLAREIVQTTPKADRAKLLHAH